jgi:hypothetical protein|tara:strand:- start:5757 stop:6194 length:438 start_codon:yes stop_codon:yes gene_type:complete
MTVGYLLDLFIINQVRKDELRDTIEADVRMDLNRQDGHLLKEIGKFLIEIADGERPGFFAKHKQYDKNIGEPQDDNIIEVIYKLYQRHKELWTLEDLRRDKNNSNKTRLDACDRVSVANKKRNDLVEMIDFIISRRLKESRQGRV